MTIDKDRIRRDEINIKARITHNRQGNVWAGILLVVIGVLALARNTLTLPDWVFTWPMILVAVGLFIGLRHNFRGGTWFFLILLGGAFLVSKIYPELELRQYLWPTILIIVGIFFISRTRSSRWNKGWRNEQSLEGISPDASAHPQDDFIDSTCIFGGTKKNVLSKNFKGGDIVNIFGGSEVNLAQADFNGRVELEVTQIFGGTKLYVPANWEVKPEIVAIFGGIEDKRDVVSTQSDKILVLKGTSIFGGIDIKRS